MVVDPVISKYAEIINALHKDWEPHNGQIPVGRALFQDKITNIFVQSGRKWGKTELILYILWRWAESHPGSSCYYISPFQKQSKEIIWANKRVQNFGPREWLLPGSSGINNTELRINFKNGSFIKCDGSDNYESYRGIEPHLIIYEEFKDFRPEFHHSMEPNLLVYNAPLVIIGTPPDHDCQYTQMAEDFKQSSTKFWYCGPTSENPYVDKQWLSNKRKELIDRGDSDEWEREYEGRYVKGGKASIFPMLKESMIKPHDRLMSELRYDLKKLNWYVIADPGTVTCFAVLFAAVNPYTKKIYLLDELYEQSQANTTVNYIGKKIIEKKAQLYQRGEWVQVADEAAAWFINEMSDRYDEGFGPTKKALNDKEMGLSLIKDALLNNKLVFSDRCAKMYWEMENYIKDDKGKIPKKNDHMIDNLRYLLSEHGYSLNLVDEPKKEADDENFRGARITDDFPGWDETGEKLEEWS
jgi:hypothetical protein